MLRWRLLLGTLFIAALLGICWLDTLVEPPGAILFLLALAVAALGAGEMLELMPDGEARPNAWVVYLGVLSTVAASGVPLFCQNSPSDCPVGQLGWSCLGVALGFLFVVLDELRRFEEAGRSTERIARASMVLLFLGLPLSFAVQLRMVPSADEGLWAVVSMIVVVKMSDIGAYTVGRLIGRHRLAPRLSPGKTWEGLAAGILFSCASSFVLFQSLLPHKVASDVSVIPLQYGWLLYGVALALAGLVGDLSESLLKREAGQKDSSRWMPGFGGVLDLLDSILAAAPVAYVCWIMGWVG